MAPLPFDQFQTIYQAAVSEIYSFWTADMQAAISRHCVGWSRERFDFQNYLKASVTRCYVAYERLARLQRGARICDVGGYWGVFPIILRRIGYEVAMTEALEYYGECFTPLFEFIRHEGVHVIDFDPFQPEQIPPSGFEAVTAMAVMEHYPHSLRIFLENLKAMVRPRGQIYLEVPNLAFLPNRIRFLMGNSPLVPATDIYRSEVPFIGHHHEFTLQELKALALLAGISPIETFSFNYSLPGGWRSFVRQPLHSTVYWLIPGTRECLGFWGEAR